MSFFQIRSANISGTSTVCLHRDYFLFAFKYTIFFQNIHSYQMTKDHYIFCQKFGELPYPVTFLILITFNNLFLVFNSSINFIIYCAVRKTFRQRILKILKSPFRRYWFRNNSSSSKRSPVPTMIVVECNTTCH